MDDSGKKRIEEAKCDFCDKNAIGYCSMQCALYCADHQKEAEKVESDMWAACEEIQSNEQKQEGK